MQFDLDTIIIIKIGQNFVIRNFKLLVVIFLGVGNIATIY